VGKAVEMSKARERVRIIDKETVSQSKNGHVAVKDRTSARASVRASVRTRKRWGDSQRIFNESGGGRGTRGRGRV
jgi:hypothetical protein